MSPREALFIARHVRDILSQRKALRAGFPDLPDIIAEAIQKAVPAFKQNEDFRQAANIADGMRLLKRTVREIVPPSFGWWLELDHDVRVSIRWLWLGHPAVTHSGGRTDSDISIVLMMLRDVDWSAEATRAMENVEASELNLLRSAQQSRRLKLSDSAHLLASLPPVQLPPPVPVALIEKQMEKGPLEIPQRRESRAEMESRMNNALADYKAGRAAGKEAAEEYREERFQPVQWSLQGMPAEAPSKRAAEFAAAFPVVSDDDDDDDESEDVDDDENDDTDAEAETPAPKTPAKPAPKPKPKPTPPPAPEPQQDPEPVPVPVAKLAPIPTGALRPRFINEEGKPRLQFGLSRDKSRGPISLMKFEPFDTLADLMRAVKSANPTTYTHAFLYGGESSVSGAVAVWEAFGHPTTSEPARTFMQRPAWHG